MKTYKSEIAGLLMAVGLLFTLAISTSAYAEPKGDRGFGGPGLGLPLPARISERMADRLGLDENQRQVVENIMEAAKPEFQALREGTRSNRDALLALDATSASYSTDLDAIAAENGRLATEATYLATRVRAEINAVLTDEQQAMLEQGMERMRENFGERRERRKGRQQ